MKSGIISIYIIMIVIISYNVIAFSISHIIMSASATTATHTIPPLFSILFFYWHKFYALYSFFY
mgnify:CR=1 FL=1